MQKIVERYILPKPSTSSQTGVHLKFPDKDFGLCLYFDYDRDGAIYSSGLRFNKVRAHRHVAELHCEAWKIKSAYDKLVELPNSEWVDELIKSTPQDMIKQWSLNHYMIYFDSDGCYEIVADSWDVLPEKVGALTNNC